MSEKQNNSLLKTNDLMSKPVISLQGDELGNIGNAIVDPEQNSVIGFTVSGKGWFKNDKGVEFGSVKSFGQYAVTVETTDQLIPLDNFPAAGKLGKANPLIGMKIISVDGRFIGTVDDFYFNPSDGKIERYILTGGIIKNLFKGRASIPTDSIQQVGRDVIIAAESVEETIRTEDGGLQENFEQLKDDMEQWKDEFEKVWDKTRNHVTELSKTVGENLKEAAATGKDKGKELLAKTSEILAEQRENLKTSYDAWMERLQSVTKDQPLGESLKKALLGLKAGKTVTDNEGEVIISEDAEVSAEVIDKAEAAGKTKELVISVAAKDLESQMESIENETNK